MSKHSDHYSDEITVKSSSIISGERTDVFNVYDTEGLATIPLVQAFIADIEIQEMRIASANIGFIKTFSKALKPTVSDE